jgi:hypothetical protein
VAIKHLLENCVTRYKSQTVIPIALEFFERQVEIFQSMIHGFEQQLSRHMFKEIKQANMCERNLFELLISSIYATTKRQIPIIRYKARVHQPAG